MKKVINMIVFVICIVLLSVNVEADKITVSDQIVDDSANKYYRIANILKYAIQVKITDENVIKHYGMINISR